MVRLQAFSRRTQSKHPCAASESQCQTAVLIRPHNLQSRVGSALRPSMAMLCDATLCCTFLSPLTDSESRRSRQVPEWDAWTAKPFWDSKLAQSRKDDAQRKTKGARLLFLNVCWHFHAPRNTPGHSLVASRTSQKRQARRAGA